MGILTQLLKLADGATEEDTVSAVQRIISDNDRLKKENVTLQSRVDDVNKRRKEYETTQALKMVNEAIKEGRIDASGKDTYLKLFDVDFESASAALSAVTKRFTVSSAIDAHAGKTELGDMAAKSWDELDRMGKLVELRDQYPDLYEEKFEQRFGCKPKK